MGARASSQGLRALERPEFVGSVHAADGAECFVYDHVRLGFDESGEFVVVSGANVVVEIVDRHMEAACIELRPADALRLAALLLAQTRTTMSASGRWSTTMRNQPTRHASRGAEPRRAQGDRHVGETLDQAEEDQALVEATG